MSKQEKEARLRAALSHSEGDRVPISDFFWSGFNKNARQEWGADTDMYRRFDLDYVVINPNMDPIIRDFEVIEQKGDDIRVRTGFGATVLRRGDLVMPHYEAFSIENAEDMQDFVIEAADDPRRFLRAGDDQINCLGDALVRNIPSFLERVNMYHEDFPVFGSVCEGYEYVWRCTGTENALYWMLLEPEKFGAFVERIGDFVVGLAQAQIDAAHGKLSGMYIWGDVAYVNGMLFSPEKWRELFKPIVMRIIEVCKKAGIMVIYHGCGNATKIYEDFIEIGLDGYNPLEVKSHLDAVELKKIYGDRLAFVGNIDVRELESGDRNRIKKEVLYKLHTAKGGGWICQSDHSISNDVSPNSYAYMVELIRDYGRFPLDMKRIDKELEELR
ncbi:MAG: uroporphyrinogen decarboxylase family protein [Christensenella sp.]